jgi:hypothetical protein
MNRTLLPILFSICAALGIPRINCDDGFTLNGNNQTDKALWYTGTSASPDIYGVPKDCYKAQAVAHYKIYDGTQGTEYACLAPPDEDDVITADELAAIKKFAARSNSISKKTLEQHETALQVKQWALGLSKR